MATNIQLLLTQGPLSKLWSNKAIITPGTNGSPVLTNGQLYVGYDTTSRRAMLFTDIDGNRYSFSADINWNDIKGDIPYASLGDFNTFQTTVETTYLKKAGDTMTGDLNMNNSNLNFQLSATTKATVEYNDTTQSLDFTFT